MKEEKLLKAFIAYLRSDKTNIQTEATVKKYAISSPNNPEIINVIYGIAKKKNLYSVTDISTLKRIHDAIERTQVDITQNRTVSTAVGHYITFLSGLSVAEKRNLGIFEEKAETKPEIVFGRADEDIPVRVPENSCPEKDVDNEENKKVEQPICFSITRTNLVVACLLLLLSQIAFVVLLRYILPSLISLTDGFRPIHHAQLLIKK